VPHNRCPVTVGRDAELAALRARVDAAVSGKGGATALVAEAGAGKSRLTREAAAHAGARGTRVLMGRAVAGRVPVPFRPLVEALGAALRTGWAVPHLGAWATALVPLLPASGGEHAPVGLTAVAEALLRCLRDFAGNHGLLLVLEDLQWADSETLTVLEYLADNLADTRIAALLTCRDQAGEATSLLEALARRGALDVLRPGRLDRPAVAAMAEACTGRPPQPAALAALVARSEGLPLFVEELVSEERTGVPPTFRDSVRGRLAELPADERRVLETAAVLDRDVDWELVQEASGSPSPVVLGALRAGSEMSLLDAGHGTALRFRHALTRDAVIDGIFPPDRALIAARALAAVLSRHPSLPGTACQQAAELAELAGQPAVAVRFLLEAGRRAVEAGALRTAESVLDRAHALAPERLDVREALVGVLAAGNRADRVFEVGERLLSVLQEPERRMEVHLQLAAVAVDATDWGLCRSHLEAARVLGGPDDVAARIELVAARAALGEHRHAAAAAAAQRVVTTATRLDLADLAAEATLVLGRCAREVDLSTAEELFTAVRREALAAGRPSLALQALGELGSLDTFRLDPTDRLVAVAAEADALGAVGVAAVARLHLAITHLHRFELDAAPAACADLGRVARRHRLGVLVPASDVLAACIHGTAGRGPEMAAALAAAGDLAGDPEWQAHAEGSARGCWLLGNDDLAGAADVLRQAAAVCPPDRVTGPPFYGAALLVDAWAGTEHVAPLPEGAESNIVTIGLARAARAVRAGRAGDGNSADHRAAPPLLGR
jgi:hypothetical protein